MILIPAIDLLDGRCVRLRQGDFAQCEAFERAPAELAEEYAAAGAKWLHVVDLAASRDGSESDTGPLFRLLADASQHVQTGGGVRNTLDVEARLQAGALRVVVGSVATEEPERFANWIPRFGADALVAALDVRIDERGTPRVRSHGWTRDSGKNLWDLLEFYASSNLRHLLCTDIGRDGLLSGPNLELYREISRRQPVLQLQASGGIRDVSDLEALAATGAATAISGKALLDGRFTIRDALTVLETAA